MSVLIDGYNLLRLIQSYEEYHQFTDVEMVVAVSDYLFKIHRRGTIIFDGTGPRDKSELQSYRNVDVVFSGLNKEADDLIEEIIWSNTAPKKLLVVSTDRRIRNAAKKRKTLSVRSDFFWELVCHELEKPEGPPPEPNEKKHGITEAETRVWMRWFGLGE